MRLRLVLIYHNRRKEAGSYLRWHEVNLASTKTVFLTFDRCHITEEQNLVTYSVLHGGKFLCIVSISCKGQTPWKSRFFFLSPWYRNHTALIYVTTNPSGGELYLDVVATWLCFQREVVELILPKIELFTTCSISFVFSFLLILETSHCVNKTLAFLLSYL